MMYRDLIDDPSFPHWGRAIILETLRTDRDPVDTVNVLEVLAETAREELQVLQEAHSATRTPVDTPEDADYRSERRQVGSIYS